MNEKKYYWIKLKTDFFSLKEIDFLLSQKNGCEYVVLYQMLILNTANTEGTLAEKIGEMIIPFNVDKIVRDTKYFDSDTVIVALELYKKLGLIYEGNDEKLLKITNFDVMVGSESEWAGKKRAYREMKEEQLRQLQDTIRTLSDKRIENRDKSIDIIHNDKIDKQNVHHLLLGLIEKRFIDINTLDLYNYNNLFFKIESKCGNNIILTIATNYTVKRILANLFLDENKGKIKNLYSYFETALMSNVAKLLKLEEMPTIYSEEYFEYLDKLEVEDDN